MSATPNTSSTPSTITNTVVKQCLDILKRDDIKYELSTLFSPILNVILYELNPYIYVTVLLVFLIFIMILAILILLLLILRNKNIMKPIL